MSLPLQGSQMTHNNLWFAGSIFRTQCLDNIILGNMPLVALGRRKKNVCVCLSTGAQWFSTLAPSPGETDEEGRCKCFPSLEKHTASSLVSRTVFWPLKTKEIGIFLETLQASNFAWKSVHEIKTYHFEEMKTCSLSFWRFLSLWTRYQSLKRDLMLH